MTASSPPCPATRPSAGQPASASPVSAASGLAVFGNLFAGLPQGDGEGGAASGLAGALLPMFLAYLARLEGVSLVVVPSVERATRLAEEARAWLGPAADRLHTFLPDRPSVYDPAPADPEVLTHRLAAMGIEAAGGGVVIAAAAALCERMHPPGPWRDQRLTVRPGLAIRPQELATTLAQLGFRRVNLVEEPGQFAVRGGLVDIFPVTGELPIRCDLFGDEIDSLKTFSPQTQRTLERIDACTIVPALEILPSPADLAAIITAVEQAIAQVEEPTAREVLQRRLERLRAHPDSRDLRELAPFHAPGRFSLWDYWSGCRLFIEDPDQLGEALDHFHREVQQSWRKAAELTPLPPPEAYYHSTEAVRQALAARRPTALSRFRQPDDPHAISGLEPVPPATDPSRESLLNDLRRWVREHYAVALVIEDETRLANLRALLIERKLPTHTARSPMHLKPGAIMLVPGPSQRGFIHPAARVAVLGEEDIFPHQVRPTGKARRVAEASLTSIDQLTVGDLVVHVDHGVAEYRGIHEMTAGGITREYLLLQYAGSDRLYVPTDQVHKVQKYLGFEGYRPTIHSLDSKVWESQKRRAQKNVEAIARELLELYAKRHAQPGFAFHPDNDLQIEMERAFPYVETPDQRKAIEATKQDMEKPTPMDRLICGDVGYGKTEVAIRAAFKAVNSGKQVAVLSPTTLLAFQHFQTFRSRLERFPVKVEMISRLRRPAEQRRILAQVEAGAIDILIGTHRLLSSDVRFKDLGLLIVDEEQRFGVKHKERLKSLKSQIDVLTLTATPIPRTLQMALSGIRQISIINTPPEDRRPVNTYVAPFDPVWAKRAIIEELKRGGQVYYVYNRVERIEQKAAFLRELVPEARLVVAHGQMDEQQVEQTMLEFIRQEHDVLLATTIIESGLDIPNVNTLIVDEAERLGLSQMYQLRGRVGRSPRQAWAYFFYSKGKPLTQEAQDRLATIEEHTALGSGFRIALRDLQIRGAGNLLGEEQSGHIASIGFTLYVELLEEAVARLKGAVAPKPVEASIEIPITALLPRLYIPEEEPRIDLYARLARCQDLDRLALLQAECEDRFGPLPPEGRALFQVARTRILASRAGVRKVTRILHHLRFEFTADRRPDPALLLNPRSAFRQRVFFSPQDPDAVNLHLRPEDLPRLLDLTGEFLQAVTPDDAAQSGPHPAPTPHLDQEAS
ncbi:MAG: Transcription-repair coupling factor [Candidatus Ozemobacter sibiricus]|uniref:Transcription-repair-coupling factor n=1 Tax=Candidatus Ozemobacter sibiricus TaxID=2268124 RepID=A0A367ZS85_9BACT|nr:MAG: Transcription-repair coupling factor [Candidatus Ozemobacter sibiricus]